MGQLSDFIEVFQQYGGISVFIVLLLCGLGLPLPEDIVLTAGGVIAGLGAISFQSMLIISFAGVLIGDLTMFSLGRFLGKKILTWGLFKRFVPADKFEMATEKFAKKKYWTLFAARFMPGLRALMYVVAGVTRKVTYLEFVLIDGFAAAISVPIWVYLGFWGADNIDELLKLIKQGKKGVLIVVGVAVLLIVSYILIKKLIEKKRRA